MRELVRRRGLDPVADPGAVRRLVDEVIAEYDDRSLTGSLPQLVDVRVAARQVFDAVAGFGPLQQYLDDPTVEEIWINEPTKVFIARRGGADAQADDGEPAGPRRLLEEPRPAPDVALTGVPHLTPSSCACHVWRQPKVCRRRRVAHQHPSHRRLGGNRGKAETVRASRSASSASFLILRCGESSQWWRNPPRKRRKTPPCRGSGPFGAGATVFRRATGWS